MPNLNRRWTAEEDARLRSMLEAGASNRMAAAKLKRTTGAVRCRSIKLRIARKKAPCRSGSAPSHLMVRTPKETILVGAVD
jgi:hypothetical protein